LRSDARLRDRRRRAVTQHHAAFGHTDWLEQDLAFALAPWLGPQAAKSRRKQARR